MTRINTIIAVVLAGLAAIAWFFTSVLSWFPSFPSIVILHDAEVQVPLAVTLSAAACFGWLLVWLSWRRGDNETRCRKCGHILRGLTQPRCPECGESI